MTRIVSLPFHRARPLVAAALAGCAALATAATPPAVPRPTPSPTQPAGRSSDYELLEVGEVMIHAKCEDGGWVYVTKKPAPGTPAATPASGSAGRARPKGITAERDTAIRAACLAVDYSK